MSGKGESKSLLMLGFRFGQLGGCPFIGVGHPVRGARLGDKTVSLALIK